MDVTQITQISNSNYDEVAKFCYPLFSKSPIDFFVYERFYDSGEALFLSSTPDVMIKWAIDELHPSKEELNLYSSFGLKTALFSHNLPLPPGTDMVAEKYEKIISVAADCHLYHILFFVDRFTSFYRVCGFGVKESNKSILNFYINTISVLPTFINYFERVGSQLIDFGNHSDLIFLPSYDLALPINNIVNVASNTIPDLDFSQKVNNTNSHLYSSITSKEKMCLELVAMGYTMKNAARKLQISPRTVEQHLRNVKDKLGVNTKNQLVEIWHALTTVPVRQASIKY